MFIGMGVMHNNVAVTSVHNTTHLILSYFCCKGYVRSLSTVAVGCSLILCFLPAFYRGLYVRVGFLWAATYSSFDVCDVNYVSSTVPYSNLFIASLVHAINEGEGARRMHIKRPP